MSILKRFASVMAYNFKDRKDSVADIKKYIAALESELGTIRSEREATETNNRRLKRDLEECEDSIEKYNRYAEKAREAGNSRDARTYESKKEELMPRYNTLKNSYDLAKENSDKMQQMEEKLNSDISLLKGKLEMLDATATSNANGEKTKAANEKIDHMINVAEALEELNNLSNNEDDDNLDKEFEELLKNDKELLKDDNNK